MKLGKPLARKKNGKKRFGLSWKDILLIGFLFLFFVFLSFGLTDSARTTSAIPISQVARDVRADKVESITVSDNKLDIIYKDDTKKTSYKEPDASTAEILKSFGADPAKVKINVEDQAGTRAWLGLLTTLLPVLIIVGVFYFIFRQARGAQESIFSFGSNKGKQFNKDSPKVKFTDVAGVDEAKQELFEVVDFLKNPEKYLAMGARSPKGVLLVGPSGTGKTLLARAVAGEAKVAFISIAGSEFMEMLVGVGAARVRDLFTTAKKSQPAIIFIDEVDAIGRQRGVGLMGGHDEREQTLNQILVEMDGFTPNEQLVVIAATNRPDILDPALVRPGRFDRRIVLPYPDIEGRKAILQIHAKNKPFTKDINWERVARRTVGFSGADLENMLNEAAILAARLNKKAIDMSDLEEAATKVKLGPEKRRIQTEDDKKITAYHEGGHAVVGYAMPHADPVHRISIVSRGMSLGHTLIPPAQDRVYETRTKLLEMIAMMLGGRAAEELVFGEITSGASDDIDKATNVARTMVLNYGMSNLGPISFDMDKRQMMYESSQMSDAMQAKVDAEVSRIMEEGYKKALEVLKKNRSRLDELAVRLVEKETIDGDEFVRVMTGNSEKKSTKKSSVKATKAN